MNWTGGHLGRSRNAKLSLNAAQKRHFANVRTRKHEEPSESKKVFPPASRESVASSDILTGNDGIHQIVDENQCHVRQPEQTAAHSPRKGHTTGNAISISSAASRSRSPSVTPSQASESSTGSLDESQLLEAYRQHLLATPDWCSLTQTQPPKFRIASYNRGRSRIGKRRRLGSRSDAGRERVKVRRTGLLTRLQRDDRSEFETVDEEVSVRFGSEIDRQDGSGGFEPQEGSEQSRD